MLDPTVATASDKTETVDARASAAEIRELSQLLDEAHRRLRAHEAATTPAVARWLEASLEHEPLVRSLRAEVARLRDECSALHATHRELRAWIAELEAARDWHNEQRQRWEAEARRLGQEPRRG